MQSIRGGGKLSTPGLFGQWKAHHRTHRRPEAVAGAERVLQLGVWGMLLKHPTEGGLCDGGPCFWPFLPKESQRLPVADHAPVPYRASGFRIPAGQLEAKHDHDLRASQDYRPPSHSAIIFFSIIAAILGIGVGWHADGRPERSSRSSSGRSSSCIAVLRNRGRRIHHVYRHRNARVLQELPALIVGDRRRSVRDGSCDEGRLRGVAIWKIANRKGDWVARHTINQGMYDRYELRGHQGARLPEALRGAC